MANGLTTKPWANRIVEYGAESPDQLCANPLNWRIHPESQQKPLLGVLDSVGVVQNVIVNKRSGFVVDGHLRVALALRTNQPSIPVTYVDLDESEEALILATLDPIAALAGQDHANLEALLAMVETDNADVQALLDSLAGDVEIVEGLTDPDSVPGVPDEPITKPGDVWILGRHRLMCGDCRDFGHVTNLFEMGERVNVAITSPPYASQRKYDDTSGFKPIPPDLYVDWFRDVAANVMAMLAEDGSFFLNIKEHCDDGQRHLYVKDLTIAHVREWGWRFVDEFCWRNTKNGVPGTWPNRFKNAWEPVFHFSRNEKIRFSPREAGEQSDATFKYHPSNEKSNTDTPFTGAYKALGYHPGIALPSNVVEIAAEGGQGNHSAPFPCALPEFFIKAFSDPGDIVYDPFMGSGTTLIAAEQTGRIAYGMEISPAYCDVIVRRFEEHTGKTAVLAHDRAMAG